ncbi:bacillithiol biosynthesis cysteine-adding enzyme BshC [Flaviaesturariibacter amylovorans]|uniref:Putative cysteine ligase BshC n=1 Tax=Flaviaesturariibacter amylovorans TaxID=1084520 RepID=A0ABP8GEQ7_9BACT
MFSAQTLAYEKTGSFSKIVTDYLAGAPALAPFYRYSPDLEGIRAALEARKAAPQHRATLVAALRDQYKSVAASPEVAQSIEALLDENTFTVTTAHQPNLLSGPLYFLYKILHAIRLAATLREQLPGYNFVPVFYMGSEDADLEELNHFSIEGKRYTWSTKQTGAVGRMTIDKEISGLLKGVEGQLSGLPEGGALLSLLRSCFQEGCSIQEATFSLVHALFARFGLVTLIADDARLKALMGPVFATDLFQQQSSTIVSDTSARLQEHYNMQAHPRAINLFYLKDDIRARIEQRGDRYQVLQTDISFSESELRTELEEHPERFSPNVILRGLYQETILPNVAFIGGGGELAYWLQLNDLFTHYGVPFPVLVLRNSFLLLGAGQKERADALGLDAEALFLPVLEQVNRHLARSGQQPRLNGEVQELGALFEKLRASAAAVDSTLDQHVAALRTRSLHLVNELEKKMQRAARRREAATQRQLEHLKQQLFPKGGLQERVENFSTFYARYGDAFIDALYRHSGALEQQFTILYP